MTVSVIILFIMGINGTDPSYTETIQSLVKSNPDWFVPASVKTVLSFAFLWGITTCTMPHVTMTTLTYKDTQTLHRAIKVGAVVVAIWLIGLMVCASRSNICSRKEALQLLTLVFRHLQ